MIEEIYNWLRMHPGLVDLRLDRVEPDGCGLFYRGETVLERHRDLLGGVCERKRVIFRIRRYGERDTSAVFFEDLAWWVTRPPHVLGGDQTVCLRDAHCVKDDDLGLALWEADLEITFLEDICEL